MSHAALQRIVVRMLYDAPYADRVYADPHGATAGCGVDDDERTWLTRPDRRAYGADPLRRSRSLTAMVEEYAVSAALIVRELGRDEGVRRLDAFFSSDVFHDGMQRGESLADLFGRWITPDEEEDRPRWGVATLERAIATARRDFDARGPESSKPVASLFASELRLAPGTVVLRLPEGTARAFGELLAALRGHRGGMVAGVLDSGLDLPTVSLSERADEGVLVDGHAGDVRLEVFSTELAELLAFCATSVPFEGFAEAALEVGAEREESVSIARGFVEDGVLLVRPHAR